MPTHKLQPTGELLTFTPSMAQEFDGIYEMENGCKSEMFETYGRQYKRITVDGYLYFTRDNRLPGYANTLRRIRYEVVIKRKDNGMAEVVSTDFVLWRVTDYPPEAIVPLL